LKVTATVNGQVIDGHLQSTPSITDILLPKRQTASHIADIWKTQKSLALSMADDDDTEAEPVGYPDCVGDGLTLYEEYRGFMENGKHIEGDPSKKDFFLENLVGGDAEPGIWLFTEVTGLAVHKDLQPSEMDYGDPKNLGVGPVRKINFNHGQGAHDVDQHGVVIANCLNARGFTIDGGDTKISQAGVHGRPGLTNAICMQWREDAGVLNPDNTHGGDVPSITPANAFLQYDIGVAHELSHSVGVDHHGEGDIGYTNFWLLGPNDPRNTTGQPVFMVEGQTQLVHLLDEATKADRGATMWERVITEVTRSCNTLDAIYSPTLFNEICQNFINGGLPIFTKLRFYIGLPHATHSGNDQCIMRYFFAIVYPKENDPSVYYISTAGTEPIGTTLCDSAGGTGINAAGRDPQPRYFDAASGRGRCQKWVCVNDKYPPVPD
jgi:hypothetical protein